MAGKNQSQRIKIIDKYLRTGRKYTWTELQDKLISDLMLDSISERSIKGDISLMRSGFMAQIHIKDKPSCENTPLSAIQKTAPFLLQSPTAPC